MKHKKLGQEHPCQVMAQKTLLDDVVWHHKPTLRLRHVNPPSKRSEFQEDSRWCLNPLSAWGSAERSLQLEVETLD